MKQINLFGKEFEQKLGDKGYSVNTESPVYKPRNKTPHILELYNRSKTNRLITEIQNSKLLKDEKNFLIDAAQRHIIFNYEKIADYYANSSKEMQYFMERSALVIIDFEKAIELGYVRLSDKLRTQYLEEYGE